MFRGHVLRAALFVGAASSCQSILAAAIADTWNRGEVEHFNDVCWKPEPKITELCNYDISRKTSASARLVGIILVTYNLRLAVKVPPGEDCKTTVQITGWRRKPCVDAGRLWGGSRSLRAAAALGALGWGLSIWAATIVGLAAVEGQRRTVGVVDCVGLGWVPSVGWDTTQANTFQWRLKLITRQKVLEKVPQFYEDITNWEGGRSLGADQWSETIFTGNKNTPRRQTWNSWAPGQQHTVLTTPPNATASTSTVQCVGNILIGPTMPWKPKNMSIRPG